MHIDFISLHKALIELKIKQKRLPREKEAFFDELYFIYFQLIARGRTINRRMYDFTFS
jgi:hypothetical protein